MTFNIISIEKYSVDTANVGLQVLECTAAILCDTVARSYGRHSVLLAQLDL